MRIFKNKDFSRYARRAGITEADLCQAADQANQGTIDADLGGGVIKQRIARSGAGKSGGFRTIILFKSGEVAAFVYGFAKNERSNIKANELLAFRKLASEVLSYNATTLARAVEAGALTEVFCAATGGNAGKEEINNESKN